MVRIDTEGRQPNNNRTPQRVSWLGKLSIWGVEMRTRFFVGLVIAALAVAGMSAQGVLVKEPSPGGLGQIRSYWLTTAHAPSSDQ